MDGSSPFLYFDSSTMQSYLYPSRGSEVVFCRRNPTPDECENDHGFDPETPNLLKTSSLKSYTTEESDNLTSFYVGLDELVHYLYVSPWSYELIDAMLEHSTYGKVRGKDLMALFELLGTEVTHNVGIVHYRHFIGTVMLLFSPPI